jgi:transposase
MRTGWFKRAHVKSEPCYRLWQLLTHRRNLKRKFLDLENAIRHSLKAFGIRSIKGVGRGGFAQAVCEAVAADALVSELSDAMLQCGPTARSIAAIRRPRPPILPRRRCARTAG